MTLERELAYFESIKADLLKHSKGKYALIIGGELLGVFERSEEAYAVGIEQRGNVPMLIKLITEQDPTDTIPALTLGLMHADI